MRRGTTPTLNIKVEGADVKDFRDIYLTIKQYNVEIDKRETDIEKDEAENKLIVPLTQEETLSFKDGTVNIQLRATVGLDGAVASNIVTLPLEHILMEGEI